MTQTTDPAEVARIFDADSRVDEDREDARPRYNVAPTQPLTVVLQRPDEGRLVEQHRWGLVPSFATSLKDGSKRINARAETVATSPSYRSSFRKRRCIGYLEARANAPAQVLVCRNGDVHGALGYMTQMPKSDPAAARRCNPSWQCPPRAAATRE